MRILFLHDWQSVPSGVNPTFMTQHSHEVADPALPEDDVHETVGIAPRLSSIATSPGWLSAHRGAVPWQ